MEVIQEQINEHKDNRSDERLAQALGLTPEELTQLEFDSTPINSGDIITAYEYKFSADSPKEILEKIKGLSTDNTIQLGRYDLEKPEA
jgi:hypothetical protein